MWIICGAISIIFCIGGWILKIKENDRAVLSAVCSLAFVIATLLVQYKMALNWVNKKDWTALMDVMPSTLVILCVYAVVLILANVITIADKKNNNCQ